MPPVTDKRKSRGFSLNEAEMAVINGLISKCAFEDKTDLLLALCETAQAMNLLPVLDLEAKRTVLRPDGKLDWKPTSARGHAKK